MLSVKTNAVFRFSVLLTIVIQVIWFFYYDIVSLSDAEYRLVAFDGYGGASLLKLPVFYWSWFIFWLVTSVSLLLYNRWARLFYFVIVVCDHVMTLFNGYMIAFPLDNFLNSTYIALSGLIIGLAYYSDLSDKFGKRKTDRDIHET